MKDRIFSRTMADRVYWHFIDAVGLSGFLSLADIDRITEALHDQADKATEAGDTVILRCIAAALTVARSSEEQEGEQ
jgi:hypothetical protein